MARRDVLRNRHGALADERDGVGVGADALTASLCEEYPVALVADHRADHVRGIGRFRSELEAGGILCRPLDGRARPQVIPLEILSFVADVLAIENAAPFTVERDFRELGEAGGKVPGQRALHIVIVKGLCRQPESGSATAEVYFDAVAWHENRPEDAVRVDVRVVVMDLVL